MDQTILCVVLALSGGFSIAGAVMDWDFFMDSRKAAFWVRLFGRSGARLFYGLLGALLVGLGIAFMTGLIPMQRGG